MSAALHPPGDTVDDAWLADLDALPDDTPRAFEQRLARAAGPAGQGAWGHGRVALLRAAAAVRAGQPAEALGLLALADMAMPTGRDAAFDLMRLLFAADSWARVGQHDAALGLLQRVVDTRPGSAPPAPACVGAVCAWLMGRSLSALGRFDEAAQWLARGMAQARAAHLPAWADRAGLLRVDAAWHAAQAAQACTDEAAARPAWQAAAAAGAACPPPVPGRLDALAIRGALVRAEASLRLGQADAAARVLATLPEAPSDDPACPPALACEIAGLRAGLLAQRGAHAQAAAHLAPALARAEALADPQALQRLTEVAIDLAARRGDAADEAHWLRRQRDLQQAALASAIAHECAVTALVLNTERALREAAEARADALAQAQAHDDLKGRTAALGAAAMRDPLTRLANRRCFDLDYRERHARSRQTGAPLPLAVIDLDHFKRVNDTHGHPVGDLVLQRVAEVLQQQCRQGDLVARLGGEEFVIVFERSTLDLARAACERVGQAVREAPLQTVARGTPVTVSVGLCDSAAHADPTDGLKAADAALYRAKHAGRDRLVVDGPAAAPDGAP